MSCFIDQCLISTAFINSQAEFWRTASHFGETFAPLLLSIGLWMFVAFVFGSPERTQRDIEREARATIKRLLDEFGDELKANPAKLIAAIYIRVSTRYQDSFESQLRAALQKAFEMGFSVSEETIFCDLGVSGAKRDRKGLEAIRAARADGKFNVFISLATSRLARKQTTLLTVLHDEFIKNGIRCILIDQILDSHDRERWPYRCV